MAYMEFSQDVDVDEMYDAMSEHEIEEMAQKILEMDDTGATKLEDVITSGFSAGNAFSILASKGVDMKELRDIILKVFPVMELKA